MKASDNLFQLIKALTPSEKRYFKIFSAKHVIGEQNNYILLFDAIESQETYDEGKIKEQFKKEKFIKHLPYEKNYLHAQIIKSLIAFGSNSINRQIRDSLEALALLYDKGLFEQCEKLIVKTKAITLSREKFNSHLELLEWERKTSIQLGNASQRARTIIAERVSAMKGLNNLLEYQSIYDKLFSFLRKLERTKETFASAKKLMADPLMRNENRAISFYAKGLYNAIHNAYEASFLDDPVASYKFSKRRVELMEERPEYIVDDIEVYIAALVRFFSQATAIGKFDESEQVIAKLKELNEKKTNLFPFFLRAKIFVTAYKLQIAFCTGTGQFELGLATIDEIEEGLKIYGDKIGIEKVYLLFHCSKIYFGAGKFRKALKGINVLINEYTQRLSTELEVGLRFLNIIVHFELKNYDLLSKEIEATYAILQKRKSVYKFEISMIDFFREINKEHKPDSTILLFKKMKIKLEEFSKDPKETIIINSSFNYMAWLDSKIEKKSFAEMVQKGAGKF